MTELASETIGSSRSRQTMLAWAALALVCAFAFFWRLGGNGIFDLDEALYVESAREMRLSGNYVIPRVDGIPFFEKPPLVYWEAAGLYALLGRSETSARLPSALATALLAAGLGLLGTRLFGRRAGLIAAAAFALCPLTFGSARQLTTDATLDLCIFAALACFWLTHTAPGPRRSRWAWGFWIASALGVLAKGLPGLLIPVVVTGLYLLLEQRFNVRAALRAAGEMRPLPGFALFLLIALPWHIAAWQQGGHDFVQMYIIKQHLMRFRGGDTSHRAPFWFYVPGFLLGFFPWSFFAIPALARGPQRAGVPAPTAPNPRLFLKVWFWVVFLMFSASGSKLISYILPLYPAAALLAGNWLARALDRREARKALVGTAAWSCALSALLLGVMLFSGPIIAAVEARTHRPAAVPPEMLSLALHLFLAAALATGAALALLLAERRRAAVGALAAGMAAFLGVAVLEGLPAVDAAFCRPLQSLAADAGRMASPERPLLTYIGPPARPSTFFYLPDRLLRQPTTTFGSVPAVQTAPDLAAMLPTDRPALLLTTAKRAGELAAERGARPVTPERDGWTLVEIPAP